MGEGVVGGEGEKKDEETRLWRCERATFLGLWRGALWQPFNIFCSFFWRRGGLLVVNESGVFFFLWFMNQVLFWLLFVLLFNGFMRGLIT